MKLPSLVFLLRAFLAVALRFPLTMVSALAALTGAMILIENVVGDEQVKLYLTGQLGVPLFTALVAFAESRGWSDWRKWVLQGGGVLILVVYYMSLIPEAHSFGEVEGLRFMALMVMAHLLVSVAPYLNKLPVADFWEYNKQLFGNIILSAAFTLIIWAGLSLAVLALNTLFNLQLDEKIYPHLFVLLAALFSTTFFLHHFPKKYTFEEIDSNYNSVFKNLCKYILIPIMGLYFLILYAYSAKILVAWDLPKGWVASLVLGFSIAGVFTYLLNYRLPKYDESPIVNNYHKWFWWVMLPLTILLAVSIWRRIEDYGVTESRFFVAHICAWLFLCSAYFAVSRTDNIKFIPVSLAFFALVSVYGPFNAFSVSGKSQMRILTSLLEQNGVLQNGKIKPLEKPLPEETAMQIESVLYYFERHEALNNIQPWLDQPLDSLPVDVQVYGSAGRLAAWMGISTPEKAAEFTVLVTPNKPVTTGNMRGYETFYRIDINNDSESPSQGRYVAFSENKRALVLEEKRGLKAVDIEVMDLQPQLKDWLSKSEGNSYYNLPAGSEVIDINGKVLETRLVVFEAEFVPKSGFCELVRLNGLLFVKDKIK